MRVDRKLQRRFGQQLLWGVPVHAPCMEPDHCRSESGWRRACESGEARPALQDAAANALYTSAGADAWPICGRYLRGPMVTPVVPQWLSGSARAHDETIVFINPEKSGDLSEFEIAIRDIIGSDFEDRVRTFDQQEGLRMFLEMFSSDDRVRDSVVADDIPAAFHIAGDLGSADEQRLRDIPGVLQVIPAGLVASQPEPMRLSISAIGLDTPVRGDAAAPTLLQGPGLLASGPRGLVAVGYGAAADEAIAHDATPHAFARLAELEVGDRARLFELVGDATAGSVEVVRHFEVDQVTATTVDELEPLPTDGPVGLVLVATGDTPGDRVVVRLLQVSPDLTAYGIDQ